MNSTYIIRIFWLLLVAFSLFGCEEEVVIDLGEIEKRLVVEAKISNIEPFVTVSLSYSQNFYDEPEYLLLKNATVSIVDTNGNKENLILTDEGVYISNNLIPMPGSNYSLVINVDEKEVEVSTYFPKALPITSVTFVPNPFYEKPDSLNIFVNVADGIGEDNYFRLRVNKKGQLPTTEYYLVDDTFGKDGIISMPIYFKNFTFGDTVIVQLYHLNAATYQYYSSLSENINGSFNSIAPGNPVSNMPDEVYGYFAGYNVSVDTIIVSSIPTF